MNIKIIKKTSNKENGYTLVELIIGLSIFAIFISIAIGGFIQALSNHRLVLKLMSATDNMSITLEQMMREMRVGTNFYVPNNNGSSVKFNKYEDDFGGPNEYSILYNYDKETHSIIRTKTRLDSSGQPTSDIKSDVITSSDVDVIYFNIKKMQLGASNAGPPRLTIVVGISASDKKLKISNYIQTTVSPRIF